MTEPSSISLRAYLTIRAMQNTGCDYFTAREAVASTAIDFPTWDMDELKTYEEWEKVK